MRIMIAITALFIVTTACQKREKEVKEHASGLLYHFYSMNPAGAIPEVGDILVLDLAIYTMDEDLIDRNDYYRMQMGIPVYQGDFNTGLSILQVDDSVCFKLDANSFYEKTRKRSLPKPFALGDQMLIRLKLKNIISAKDLDEERLNRYHANTEQEELLLKDYLEITNVNTTPTSNGIYVIIKEKGQGKTAVAGSRLKVHYTGTTIDGKVFDSSLHRNNPLEFVLGAGQVIPGWDEGLLGLQAGTRVRLIIPSPMAYGQEGFKSIILPYSTLIFEIELLSVVNDR